MPNRLLLQTGDLLLLETGDALLLEVQPLPPPPPRVEVREAIRFVRRFAHVHEKQTLLQIARVEFECQRGVGLNTGQGQEPQLMLRCSYNGGMTFGNERWGALGPIGKYRQRAVFYNLGQARSWVFEVSVSDPVQLDLMACYLTINAGAF